MTLRLVGEAASVQERLARERVFHNEKRFGDGDNRQALDRWYAAIAHGAALQWRQVREHAAGKVVLEYGCADGSTLLGEYRTHERAREAHGIDISDVAVLRARERAGRLGVTNARFQVGNAEDMPYPDGTFDLVYGRGIIHHLDLQRAFRELRRVLKPGGLVSFYEPMGHNPLINRFRSRTPDLRTPDEHPLRMKDFALARRHFRGVETRFFGLTTLVSVPLGGRFMEQLKALDRLLFLIPGVKRNAWHVLMTGRR